MLGNDLSTHEQHHQRRHQRDRQHGRSRHGEGLGVGERPEQAPLLRLESEDRQKRHRNDEQREEQRRADLRCGFDENLQPWLVGRRAFHVLVRVLDHDDGGVDHGADGDGDAAEAHDVGSQPDAAHGQERQQHGQGQGQYGDQCAAEMEQEDDDDQADDEALFNELPA